MVKKKAAKKTKTSYASKKNSSEDSLSFNISFDVKLLKKALPIILIIIAMWFAFFVRSGPISLDGMDERVEAGLYNQVQNIIAQQVDTQYSNLDPSYKAELVHEEYQKVLNTGIYEYEGQRVIISDLAKQQSEHVKNVFKFENGQTYLSAIDPYFFLRKSENLLETGTIGDVVIEGVPYENKQLSPALKEVGKPNFHVWLQYQLLKLKGLDANSPLGEKVSAVFILSAILATLTVIPMYFILRKYANDGTAFLGSLLLVSVGTFVSRTVAGFVDTDAYNVLFPLIVTAFLVYAISAKKILMYTFSILAGFFLGLFMWTWPGAWFIFVFISASLVGFIGFLISQKFISQKININKLKEVGSVFVLFIVSSYLFTFLLAGKNLFTSITNGVSGSGISTISQTNIWPNVYSSVAELNPASFNQVIGSVGGKLVFFLALLGLLLLALDFKPKLKKAKNLIGFLGVVWFLAIIFQGVFVSLTANNDFLFLGLLFLPVGAALLYSWYSDHSSEKVFLVMLLASWMAGTIYMSFNGVRFILLLAPAFAISFGFGLYYISSMLNGFVVKEFKPKSEWGKSLTGFVAVGILFLLLFVPIAQGAIAISKGSTPNFDDHWYGAMEQIKEKSSKDAIITSWWDFGHYFALTTQRGVTFDGSSQTTPQAHWVGRLLLEGDEKKATDILRMLVCGGNDAFNIMVEIVNGDNADAVKVNKIITSTFGENRKDTRRLIENNSYYSFTDSQVDQIMEKLSCENPRENIVITSGDMVGKAGVWAHWGSWDFIKKYVHDNYISLSSEEIALNIDENVTLIKIYVAQLEQIDVRSRTQNINRNSLINQWFAPYPSYAGQVGCSVVDNGTVLSCQNDLRISLETARVLNVDLNSQFKPKNIIFPLEDGLRVIEQDPQGTIDIVVVKDMNGYSIMLSQTPLGTSLFTRLYYLNGIGTQGFEEIYTTNTQTAQKVSVWRTLFNQTN